MEAFRRRLLMKSSGGGLPVGTTFDFPYKGEVQEVTLPKGTYRLECWGAQGGYRSSAYYGGKGGYSVGELTLKSKTKLYIYVGGSGNTGGTEGGFNGGGKRASYSGGGGATDFRIGEDSLYARVIVAGGGGSDGATNKTGMYGGGTIGGTSSEPYGTGGFGGTQTGVSDSSWQTTTQSTGTTSYWDAYAGFGFGGNGITRAAGYGGAGGGGWYGGSGVYPDASGDDDRGGGGGSGYVYALSTASSYPSGCMLNADHYLRNAKTYAGNTTIRTVEGGDDTGHSGDGYARITVIRSSSDGGSSVLPNDYAEVGYIEASGNAYVNTNVYPSKSTRVKMDFAFTNTAFQQRIFGNRDSNNTDFCFESYINGVGEYAWSCEDGDGNWTRTYVMADTNRHEIDLDSYNNQVSVEGYSATISTNRTRTSSYPIYLASTNRMDEGYISDRTAYIRIYGCQIFESGTLVRDYIPVLRKSDCVYGLFDKVNSEFYPSVSGTNFTGA